MPRRTIYLDYNATTPLDPQVRAAMMPLLDEVWANPSSIHHAGRKARVFLDDCRERTAKVLGCKPSEVIFTSGGTESVNLAIFGSARQLKSKGRHLISSVVEHHAVLHSLDYLRRNEGFEVTLLPVDRDGRVSPKSLKEAIRPDTALVSIMAANNEIGTIQPVVELGRICRDRGVLFHTDAVQAVGKIPLTMASSKIDMLSLSGHKLHAPKGIGALYLRKGVPFRPFMVGGHQEKSRRAGTEATASIIALGKACELAGRYMDEENTRVKAMRDRLEKALMEMIPNRRINGGAAERLPNTTSIAFEFVEGELILLYLSEKGICASSGSACTSGSLEPSHVLRAMGVPFTCAHGSIRFSLSRFNTDEEIDFVISELPSIIRRGREMSPFGREFLAQAAT